ncbi:hypothetical protein J2752_001687 [Halarchaeum rubridurum]|uniref:Uncharacterized protein n=1 Tax=Halarchaeum rubridurum TaxID=489911 RepID=A0A830FTR7_9EURY|nr:hypothetical protein [Halarchaeum rubridurum]MBP1954775.1 hypothetical protein [Halarchaeum rubridurum]GGM59670.1 hypothetical protein GCM10009017_07250 [Halarchaeum rubridurum]
MRSGSYSLLLLVVGCLGLCIGATVFLREFLGAPLAVATGVRVVGGGNALAGAIIVTASFALMAFAAVVFYISRGKHRRRERVLRRW